MQETKRKSDIDFLLPFPFCSSKVIKSKSKVVKIIESLHSKVVKKTLNSYHGHLHTIWLSLYPSIFLQLHDSPRFMIQYSGAHDLVGLRSQVHETVRAVLKCGVCRTAHTAMEKQSLVQNSANKHTWACVAALLWSLPVPDIQVWVFALKPKASSPLTEDLALFLRAQTHQNSKFWRKPLSG